MAAPKDRFTGLRDKISMSPGSPIAAGVASGDLVAKPRKPGDKPGVTAKLKAVDRGKRVA